MAKNKPRSTSELYSELSSSTGLTRKQVASVFDGMTGIIKKDLAKGPGIFSVPGLMKITVIKKPATKAATKPNPFKPGEMMDIPKKPASIRVKVLPLKKLKGYAEL